MPVRTTLFKLAFSYAACEPTKRFGDFKPRKCFFESARLIKNIEKICAFDH